MEKFKFHDSSFHSLIYTLCIDSGDKCIFQFFSQFFHSFFPRNQNQNFSVTFRLNIYTFYDAHTFPWFFTRSFV